MSVAVAGMSTAGTGSSVAGRVCHYTRLHCQRTDWLVNRAQPGGRWAGALRIWKRRRGGCGGFDAGFRGSLVAAAVEQAEVEAGRGFGIFREQLVAGFVDDLQRGVQFAFLGVGQARFCSQPQPQALAK